MLFVSLACSEVGRSMLRTWQEFLQRRIQRSAAAQAAAPELRSGDDGLALALLSSWRFTGVLDDRWSRVVLDRLLAADVRPRSADLAVVFGPPSTGPGSSARLPETEHRKRLGPTELASAPDPLAWALAELAAVGDWLAASRAAWSDEAVAADPERDAQASWLWAQWASGSFWDVRSTWDEGFLPVARRAFGGVLVARGVPAAARARILERFAEEFFFRLCDGSQPPSGWAVLAARVLETAPGGPALPVVRSFDSEGRANAARCVAGRGVRAASLESLLPGRAHPELRGRDLMELQPADAVPEAFLDAHVALRLLSLWARGRCTTFAEMRNVAVQGRSKGRGRLRAVAAAEPTRLLEAVLGLDRLHARTAGAVARLAESWAWDEYPDFAFGIDHALAPACEAATITVAPLDDDEAAVARTWVLLAVLRGQAVRLRRWVERGGTGDKDPTWGRLLKQDVPDALTSPAPGRGRDYSRLRLHLAAALPLELAALTPTVAAIADLGAGLGRRAADRALPGHVRQILAPLWIDSTRLGDRDAGRPRFPKGGYPSAVEHARAFVDDLESSS